MTQNTIDNFWNKVVVKEDNECWPWTGGNNGKDGYGRFRIGNKKYSSHRISFFLHNGNFPKGIILHSCDNPACCNPKHLSDGDYSKNIRDAYLRGRANPKIGELNGRHVLTSGQVIEIKNSKESQRKIAKKFGVCQRTVCAIKNGKLWSSITGIK